MPPFLILFKSLVVRERISRNVKDNLQGVIFYFINGYFVKITLHIGKRHPFQHYLLDLILSRYS